MAEELRHAHTIRLAGVPDIDAVSSMLARSFDDDPSGAMCCPPRGSEAAARGLHSHSAADRLPRLRLGVDDGPTRGCGAVGAPGEADAHGPERHHPHPAPAALRRRSRRVAQHRLAQCGRRAAPQGPPLVPERARDRPSHQRRGIASALMAPALRRCDEGDSARTSSRRRSGTSPSTTATVRGHERDRQARRADGVDDVARTASRRTLSRQLQLQLQPQPRARRSRAPGRGAHRWRAPVMWPYLRRKVADGLDVVCPRVAHEGAVVVGVVLRPQARGVQDVSAKGDGGLEEGVDGRAIGRCERHVDSRNPSPVELGPIQNSGLPAPRSRRPPRSP